MKKELLFALALMLSAGTFAQDKMDAYSMSILSGLRSDVAGRSMSKAKTTTSDNNTDAVRAFITVNSPAVYARLRMMGVEIGYNADNLATATIPLSAIDAVLAMPEVAQMQISRPMRLHTDLVRAACYVDDVHQGKDLVRPYKGKGVIYGTVDSGIDFQHAAFKDDSGKSRIKMVYLPDALRKQAGAKANYPVSIGDYSSTLRGYVYDTDGLGSLTTGSTTDLHGTHTASIAAGNPYGSADYYGMAPDADLILVDSPTLRDADIIDGVAFIFAEAAKQGKPAVVNLSLGSNIGPHNDMMSFNKLLNQLAGPGRIICISAGNEGHASMWISKPVGATVSTIVTGTYAETMQSVDGDIDIWGKDDKTFSMKLYARNTTTNKLYELYNSTKDNSKVVTSLRYFKRGTITVSLAHSLGNNNIAVQCSGVELRSDYDLVMQLSGDSYVDAWGNNGAISFVGKEGTDYVAGSADMSLNTVACYDNAISVGSYNTTPAFVWAGDGKVYGYPEEMLPRGEVSYFSSYGIDRDGRQHPTVLAPGAMITAAYNYYCSNSKLTDKPEDMVAQYDEKDGRIQPYGADMGTSMACPAVSGIIALWLEQNPTLSPQDVKNIIGLTAMRDEYIAGDEKRSGMGKINALEGMKKVPTDVVQMVKGTEPIVMASEHGFTVLVPEADGRAVVEVYAAGGQCVMNETVSAGMTHSFRLAERGMYVVKVGKTVKKVVF